MKRKPGTFIECDECLAITEICWSSSHDSRLYCDGCVGILMENAADMGEFAEPDDNVGEYACQWLSGELTYHIIATDKLPDWVRERTNT